MITRVQIETISQYSIFPQPDVPQSCPVVCLEDHHVVQEAAGVVTQLVSSSHGAQHFLLQAFLVEIRVILDQTQVIRYWF